MGTCWIDGSERCSLGYCRDAGKLSKPFHRLRGLFIALATISISLLTLSLRIVEYATREQAQNAVATLSNQNLMGRLVYVREVCRHWKLHPWPSNQTCPDVLISNVS